MSRDIGNVQARIDVRASQPACTFSYLTLCCRCHTVTGGTVET